MEPIMDKDNQKAGEELIDEEDLLNFELDDLSLDDMEKKASEFEDDIIELVDLVDKGPERSEKSKKKEEPVLAEEDPADEDQEEFGFETDEITSIGDLLDEESLDHSASNLDLAGLSLSDLNEVPKLEPEKPEAKGEISEDDLEEMLEDAPTEMLNLEFQEEALLPEEADSALEQEEKPAEALVGDTLEAKESDVEEVQGEDIKDMMQEADVEDMTLDFGEAEEIDEKEITAKELGEMLKAAEITDVPLDLEAAPEEETGTEVDEDKAPTEIISLDLEEGKEPSEALSLDLEKDIGISEQTLDDIDEAAATELLKPLEEEPSQQESTDFATAEAAFEEPEELPIEPAAEQAVGISEAMIEDIVSRVVQDVVERVTRETMIEVAERVITEAIDALKKSLETISD
jgi:hypothetical protein